MPRRYRPPVKRRKTKKQTILDITAEPQEPAGVIAPPAAAPRTAVSNVPTASRGEGRHVARDYSYVGMEIRRIALVGGFIVLSLILTAIFLR